MPSKRTSVGYKRNQAYVAAPSLSELLDHVKRQRGARRCAIRFSEPALSREKAYQKPREPCPHCVVAASVSLPALLILWFAGCRVCLGLSPKLRLAKLRSRRPFSLRVDINLRVKPVIRPRVKAVPCALRPCRSQRGAFSVKRCQSDGKTLTNRTAIRCYYKHVCHTFGVSNSSMTCMVKNLIFRLDSLSLSCFLTLPCGIRPSMRKRLM